MNPCTDGAPRHARIVRTVAVMAMVVAVLVVPGRADAGDTGVAIGLANQTRAAHGLAPLTYDPELQYLADRQAAAMAAHGALFHTAGLGSQLSWGWWAWAENVGYGPSVGRIHSAFLNSPHHASNLLSWDYNYVGVGVAYGGDGSVYVAQVFGAW